MNWKNRLTNYNFWISLFSAVLLILQALKIEFDIAYVNEIFTAVLGLLVVIGIMSDPTRTTVKSNEAQKPTVETTAKQKEKVEEVKQEEIKAALPIAEENEVGDVSAKNDFQIILNKISNELDEKIKELENFNLHVIKDSIVQEEVSQVETKTEELKEVNVEIVTPAAAENDNPYINVIN